MINFTETELELIDALVSECRYSSDDDEETDTCVSIQQKLYEFYKEV